jgi:hypothetical protein
VPPRFGLFLGQHWPYDSKKKGVPDVAGVYGDVSQEEFDSLPSSGSDDEYYLPQTAGGLDILECLLDLDY